MKLKSENPRNATSALNAFFAQHRIQAAQRPSYSCRFEHGQLWIISLSGAAWSVVDAESRNDASGYGFEQVSEGEEY